MRVITFNDFLLETQPNKLLIKIKTYDKKQLMDIAQKLGDSDDELTVLNAVLDVLETKMPEKEFVSFCEKL